MAAILAGPPILALLITGLPFTINNNINARSAPVFGVGDGVQFPNGVLSGHGNDNNTGITIFVNLSNGGTRVSPTIQASSTCFFHFYFSYI